jgi:hypothetical protein
LLFPPERRRRLRCMAISKSSSLSGPVDPDDYCAVAV